MIGVFVEFDYNNDFDAAAISEIAVHGSAQFLNMTGLRSKAFTVDPENRRAANFYVWDSEAAARAFFTDDMLDHIEGIYGVRPTVRFVDVCALVDNAAGEVVH